MQPGLAHPSFATSCHCQSTSMVSPFTPWFPIYSSNKVQRLRVTFRSYHEPFIEVGVPWSTASAFSRDQRAMHRGSRHLQNGSNILSPATYKIVGGRPRDASFSWIKACPAKHCGLLALVALAGSPGFRLCSIMCPVGGSPVISPLSLSSQVTLTVPRHILASLAKLPHFRK